MTAYTWTLDYGTKVRTYRDARREIVARMTPVEGGYSWAIVQWDRVLDAGHAPKLAEARTAAETWIQTLTEVTPA